MIREAKIEDILKIVELLKEFYNSTDMIKVANCDSESSIKTIKGLIENENTTIMIIDIDGKIVGCLGAVVLPYYFNFQCLTGHEFFWFVSEKYRGTKESLKLFKVIEEWAKNKGAKTMIMTSLVYNIDALKKFYKRNQYVELETSFIRSF